LERLWWRREVVNRDCSCPWWETQMHSFMIVSRGSWNKRNARILWNMSTMPTVIFAWCYRGCWTFRSIISVTDFRRIGFCVEVAFNLKPLNLWSIISFIDLVQQLYAKLETVIINRKEYKIRSEKIQWSAFTWYTAYSTLSRAICSSIGVCSTFSWSHHTKVARRWRTHSRKKKKVSIKDGGRDTLTGARRLIQIAKNWDPFLTWQQPDRQVLVRTFAPKLQSVDKVSFSRVNAWQVLVRFLLPRCCCLSAS
jgi:hypothetical protein